jgi:hypothetical protein
MLELKIDMFFIAILYTINWLFTAKWPKNSSPLKIMLSEINDRPTSKHYYYSVKCCHIFACIYYGNKTFFLYRQMDQGKL